MLSDQFLVEMRLDRERVPGFDAYPYSLNAVKNLDVLALHRSVTFIIGENGSGKSTLLEALAVAWGFNAEGGTQFIIATHSPILMAYPDAWIYQLEDEGISHVTYTDTEHYQVARDFLNNYETMLGVLLAD